MVATAPRTTVAAGHPAGRGPGLRSALVLGVAVAVAVVALTLPAWPAGPDMGSTHYMGLLAANQPWNLILFMAVPVVAAETVAVTELVILFSPARAGRTVRALNRYVGIFAGFYFVGVVAYLLRHAVVPLTVDGGWRGPADVVAVGFYLLGLVPLLGITLLETGVLGSRWDERARLKAHATFVGVFLVVAHVAMIAGMLDPTVLGWDPTHVMDDGSQMEGMTH
ncbi:hypothetical protein Cfla_3211 [Cellulomonas flavigena DSM 20109]|uniref:Permease n=1 Tax=Cellulomonas flavigena (strain ATCC 482 / DSM 20109 / BCRC 11376 / JCM 18109 / NBRC 3775 / NCIMB 8073 / NRS 134) TaxID=446466 RepID=D5ULY7_CELFN|nr:DUF6803 family protein [Cellulomonas flavigena]ADG76093.1 hypothetical protein Cfla_3211 [Cellulomonas flavigena DSM 20109]